MTSNAIVYVVDADSSVRRSLKRLITSFGITVRTFASFEEYLESTPIVVNACMIIDAETAQNDKNVNETIDGYGEDFHVIVITVSDSGNARRLAMDLGAVICLQKPVDDQALLDSIRWSFGKESDQRKAP